MTPAGSYIRQLQPASTGSEHADPVGLAPVRLRNIFTIISQRNVAVDGSRDEHHRITAPKHGPGRSDSRHAIMAVLHHAAERRHRVAFLVTLGDYSQHPLTPQGGYEADLVLQCLTRHVDPYAWLQRQILSSSPALHAGPVLGLTTDTNAIIGVNIHTWPPKTATGTVSPARTR